LIAAALVVGAAFTARAQGVVERQITAAPGRDARVGIYSDIRPDCTPGPLPAIKLVAAPLHGTVTVKRGTLKATNLKQCLATEVPVFIAFYHSDAGFNGGDEFELQISFPAGRTVLQHFRVNVTTNPAPNNPVTHSPGSGQGI
jgi:hypothetical protein